MYPLCTLKGAALYTGIDDKVVIVNAEEENKTANANSFTSKPSALQLNHLSSGRQPNELPQGYALFSRKAHSP